MKVLISSQLCRVCLGLLSLLCLSTVLDAATATDEVRAATKKLTNAASYTWTVESAEERSTRRAAGMQLLATEGRVSARGQIESKGFVQAGGDLISVLDGGPRPAMPTSRYEIYLYSGLGFYRPEPVKAAGLPPAPWTLLAEPALGGTDDPERDAFLRSFVPLAKQSRSPVDQAALIIKAVEFRRIDPWFFIGEIPQSAIRTFLASAAISLVNSDKVSGTIRVRFEDAGLTFFDISIRGVDGMGRESLFRQAIRFSDIGTTHIDGPIGPSTAL